MDEILLQQPELTAPYLRKLVAYFIAECNLPFRLVEQDSFLKILTALNPQAGSMMVKRKAMAYKVTNLYLANLTQTRGHLQIHWLLWASLPMQLKTSGTYWMLSLVYPLFTHSSNPQFITTLSLQVCTLDKPLEVCLFTLSMISRYSTAFVESQRTMLPTTTHLPNILLGCMAHVINLAAQDGLKLFGTSAEGDPNAEISINSSPMSISNMFPTPDGTGVDLKTVINQLHSLSVHIVCNSEAPGDLEAPESDAQNATSLILDVKTHWNSTQPPSFSENLCIQLSTPPFQCISDS
ncbi:uncharacterized protein VP01_2715g2 [Puccinia sorghi]|uniref:DUF659 domain-containing protein n=1 Tax=Puccinia sorghi TaxID=27349 RepID=A0A0L6V3I5_9BASI|nr:uncharacterized protein VP01_2715g2 [Puccinia sorghi]